MDAFTLDQVRLLLAVVDAGSFSGAARQLNRAQSAITYGIQTLERQIDVVLFDRSAYRPVLTEAGRALVLQARRISEEASMFGQHARSMARGLEPELTLVLDSMFPMAWLVTALRAFTAQFPTVPPRILVQPLGAAAEALHDGSAMIGLLPTSFCDRELLHSFQVTSIDLVTVVAPDHPIAALASPIATAALQQHVQLVLTDRSSLTDGRDFGVLSARTWRLADLGAKHAMLLAGLGFGNMPTHMVESDLRSGRLKRIQPAALNLANVPITMSCAVLAERRLGPAAQWLLDHLAPKPAVTRQTGSAAPRSRRS